MTLPARIDPDGPPLPSFDRSTEEGRRAFVDRLIEVSNLRLAAAKERLIEAGVIHEDGSSVSDELPPDMLETSQTSVETG